MPNSRSETSSPGWSGGLSGALDISWVQGFVWNSPFSHTREVISPSCRVNKEGRGPDGPSSLQQPLGWHLRQLGSPWPVLIDQGQLSHPHW